MPDWKDIVDQVRREARRAIDSRKRTVEQAREAFEREGPKDSAAKKPSFKREPTSSPWAGTAQGRRRGPSRQKRG